MSQSIAEKQAKHRVYMRKWYKNNRSKQIALVQKNRDKIQQWMFELKQTLKCNRCPESHWACLDFHHTDPATKDIALSHVSQMGWGKEKIFAEIAKCEVLCANCHRKHHLT